MATTTNYAWTTPDDSSLVKDGASAIRALGTAIDTSMNTALGTKKAGMVLLNTTSFSGVASTSLPADTFTSTYNYYRVVLDVVGADVNFNMRLRTAGSDNSTSNYWYGGFFVAYGAGPSVTAFSGPSAVTGFNFAGAPSIGGGFIIDIFNPKSSTLQTQIFAASAESFNRTASCQFRATTSFDSCTFYPSSGNITGSYSVYGYNK